jgi:hypothetical protein
MKFNQREAQRVRDPHLHEFPPQPGAVGTPQAIISPTVPPKTTVTPIRPANRASNYLLRRVQQWFATRSEPRITPVTDPLGQTWWKVYNPRTQTLQWLDSEAEVMIWLDNQPDF